MSCFAPEDSELKCLYQENLEISEMDGKKNAASGTHTQDSQKHLLHKIYDHLG